MKTPPVDESGATPLESRSVNKRVAHKMVRLARQAGLLHAYSSLRTRLVKHKAAILAYHRIDRIDHFPWSVTAVPPQVFEAEINHLRRRYRLISLDELAIAIRDCRPLPLNAAVVTFDDGYKDFYINSYPILRKYDVPATVFLTTGPVDTGQLFWSDRVRYAIWKTKLDKLELDDLGSYRLNRLESRISAGRVVTEKLKKLYIRDRDQMIEKLVRSSGVDIPSGLGKELILSWEEIKEMSKNGISFGAHTVSHPILTRVPLETAREEILGSKRRIEAELDHEVKAFCYPNGGPDDINEDIENILRSNGFNCAVTLAPAAFVLSKSQLYRLPRIAGPPNYDTFELLLSGLYFDMARIRSHLGG
jgi:peptidoglycan/xylan/chitin deacetylase (PgdA/CDA1 family)